MLTGQNKVSGAGRIQEGLRGSPSYVLAWHRSTAAFRSA